MFSKVIRKVKEKFVKKVVLNSFILEGNNLIFNLDLFNFIKPIRGVEAYLYNGESIHSITYSLSGKSLDLKLPIDTLENREVNKRIQLIVNGQTMWITKDENSQENYHDIVINSNLFVIEVDKSLWIKNAFIDYQFSENHYMCEIVSTGYEYLEIKINKGNSEKISMYAIKGNRIRELELEKSLKGTYVLSDITSLSTGNWKLYIESNGYMYRILLTDKKYIHKLKTYHHIVEVYFDKTLKVNLLPHVLTIQNISINKINNQIVEVELERVSSNSFDENRKLIIQDSVSRKEIHSDIEYIDDLNKEKLKIDLRDIFAHSFTRVRLFIDVISDQPIRYQFDLGNTDLKKAKMKFSMLYKGEVVTNYFYKRKDKSLGLLVQRPRIEKEITKIEDFTFYGYVKIKKHFKNCTTYLCLEERISQNSDSILIDKEHFQIDLSRYKLTSIMPDRKGILDFYLVIKNEDDEIIRKEKIKYKHSDYKKDNYYGNKTFTDEHYNKNYFLITTTPFNNLKLESFTIPSTVKEPVNVEEKDENVWLVGERYDTAQDNGIVFFRWLKENTNINVYYVINEESPDFEKVKGMENILKFGSREHFEIAMKAKVLLGTHDLENLLPYKAAPGFFYYENTFKVFLQHGVLGRKNVEYHKKYYEDPFDLIIVSSDAEKHDIVVDKWGYSEAQVSVTGLARFDNLIQKEKPKNILLMPTWRDWINTDTQFMNSEYFIRYSNLITNEKLLGALRENNVLLNFYPHFRSQMFFSEVLDKMDKARENIRFIELGSQTVQDLLIEHALLITDYSSVSFDFTLMNKPVIYYHFDRRRFFRNGILRPIDETFIGEIATTEDQLIDLIINRINENFAKYNKDISGIIKYQDRFNCERIYTEIRRKLKKVEAL